MAQFERRGSSCDDEVGLRFVVFVEVDRVLRPNIVVRQLGDECVAELVDDPCVGHADGRHLAHFTVHEFEPSVVREGTFAA